MEIVMDNKKIAVVLVAFALMAAAVVYLALPDAKEGGYSGSTVDDDLSDMSWQDILAEAKGQNVHLSFYQDQYNNQFFDEVLIPAAKRLGVNVTYGADLGYIGAMKDSGAMADGGKPTYDMYWMGVSGYVNFQSIWWADDWKSVIPNVIYLPENTDEQVSYAINSTLDGYVGNEIQFSGGQLVMIYNHDTESPDVEYNQVKLTGPDNTVYIVDLDDSSTTAMTWANAGTGTFKSTELVNFLKSTEGRTYKDVKFGLPADYDEVFKWAKIYPGQFTYCDPTWDATSYYIGYSFMYGALYELDWNFDKSGWVTYSGDIKARAKAIDADLATLGTGLAAAFSTTAGSEGKYGYLFKYLDALDPYVHKQDSKSWYPTLSNDLYRKMIGYSGNPALPETGSVMLAYSVVTSQYNRLTDAGFNTGIYSLDTSIMEQYCWTINKESNSKAGALVVANLLQDPEMQAQWYQITGEIVNLDLEKYQQLLGKGTTHYYEDQYNKNFGFLDDWATSEQSWAYLDPEELSKTAVGANPSKYYITLGGIWDAHRGYA
jgi:ABC-type uncharacterized transport system, periplasmic component